MPNEIRRPGIGPQGPGEAPTLNEKEAAKVKAEQAKQRPLSPADAARVAQQAGFHRANQRRLPKRFDIGDSSHAPIPLPEDEVTEEVWSPERLEAAQDNLSMASAQFSEVAKGEADGMSLGEAVVSSSFLPTEDGVQGLQALADKPAPQPLPLDEVTTNVRALFNIDLGREVPVGHKVLAAGLVVSGEADSVAVAEGQLDEQKLSAGLQKVAERSNQAVGEAQKMSKGINRELNLQRTFVVKR